MAAPKGHKGYKKKGSISHKTIAWNNLGDFLIEDGADRLKQLLRDADDDQFIKYYILLIEYFKPKMIRSDVKQTNSGDGTLHIIRQTIGYPQWLVAPIGNSEGDNIEHK